MTSKYFCSPNLNNIVIVGSMCAYLAVLLLGIDTRLVSKENFERLCYVSVIMMQMETSYLHLDQNLGSKRRFYTRLWLDVCKNLACS